MLNIHSLDPHATLFTQALAASFPGAVRVDQAELLDLVTAEIIATKNIRNGPALLTFLQQ